MVMNGTVSAMVLALSINYIITIIVAAVGLYIDHRNCIPISEYQGYDEDEEEEEL